MHIKRVKFVLPSKLLAGYFVQISLIIDSINIKILLH